MMNTIPNFYQPQTLTNPNMPTFQEGVIEVQYNNQVPFGLAQFAALSALSVAIQGLIDVRTPTDTVVPVSLYLMSIAMSGERKSKTESEYLFPVRDFEEKQNSSYKEDYATFVADHEIWAVKQDALRKAYQKKVVRGEDAETEAAAMQMHLHVEPVCPKKVRLLYEDATKAALLQGLHFGVPSAGLFSSEGSVILDGPLFNAEQAIANSFWSGSPVVYDRVSSESFTISDARLTISIMAQPGVVERYWIDKGEKARSTGLMARMLTCYTGTTQGTRFIYNPEVQWTYRDRFRQRISEILEEFAATMKMPGFKRKVVQFSYGAKTVWLGYYNQVERNIQLDGYYAQAGDHASKLADNVARVAALFHYFEGFHGDISEETVRAAILIVSESSRNFMETFIFPSGNSDANVLDGWLTGLRNTGVRHIRKNDVLRKGPPSLRKRDALNSAIESLVQAGSVRLYRHNKTYYLDLYPGSFRWGGLGFPVASA